MTDLREIERSLKPGEIKTLRPGDKTFSDIFLDELHKVEQEFTQAHKPFDRACARIDYDDKYAAISKEIERLEGSIDYDDQRLKIDFGDIRTYGDISRFQKISEAEDVINRNIDGMQVPTKVGSTEFYICTHRKHRIGVFIPIKTFVPNQDHMKNPEAK